MRLLRLGSSPLARGLRGADDVGSVGRGIIPARAGFTFLSPSLTHFRRDHPRSRGVYAHFAEGGIVGWGSSPLARGLRVPTASIPDESGIIPARAGFTNESTSSQDSHSDHPRSRGVYFSMAPAGSVRMGSSPLARGLLTVPVDKNAAAGIIPARAGFTCSAAGR